MLLLHIDHCDKNFFGTGQKNQSNYSSDEQSD
jgi:hypothetical protein